MKKRIALRAATLVIAMVISISAFLTTSCLMQGRTPRTTEQTKQLPVNRVDISLPQSDDLRLAAEQMGAMTVRSYMVARMYLTILENYDSDEEEFDMYEFLGLLQFTIDAFENTEKFNALFEQLADALSVLEEDENDSGTLTEASFEILEEANADGGRDGLRRSPFSAAPVSAKGNEKKTALAWAQDVVDTANNAQGGQRLKTLAKHLGTDCKRAFLILQQANDMLEGGAYEDLGDLYNKAYQTAYALKAAGTTAGFTIGVITAAPAATTAGAVLSTGGTIFSGVNTVLEVSAAGAVIYNNGDDNVVTATSEAIGSAIAPVGQVFALTEVAGNVKGIFDSGKEIFKDKKLWDGLKSLAQPESYDLADDAFGALSYIAGSISDYNDGGKILSGTFTHTEDGLKFTLMDTLCGRDPEEKKAVRQKLQDLGHDPALFAADAQETSETETGSGISAEMVDRILQQNEAFNPAFYQEELEYILSETESLIADLIESESVGVPPGEIEPEPAAEDEQTPEIGQTPAWDPYGISGIYTMDITQHNKSEDGIFKNTDRARAFVNLYSDNRMEIEFIVYEPVSYEIFQFVLDDYRVSYQKLYGTYDPETKTFKGMGKPICDDPFFETRWNLQETELTFSTDATPYTAVGGMQGAEDAYGSEASGLQILLLPKITVTMEKLKNESAGLSPRQIYGAYHFSGFLKEDGKQSRSEDKSPGEAFGSFEDNQTAIEGWIADFGPGTGGGLKLRLQLAESNEVAELEGAYDVSSATAVFTGFPYEGKNYDLSVHFFMLSESNIQAVMNLGLEGEAAGQLIGSRTR